MQIKCFKATGTLEHSTAQQEKKQNKTKPNKAKQGNATFQTFLWNAKIQNITLP